MATTTRTRRPVTAPPIEDLSAFKDYYNIGVYADSGVGKTVLVGSHPKALILAVDRGTISAARFGSKAKAWRIPDWPEFEKAMSWLKAGNHSKYEWIILDSFTMLRERCMRYTLAREHERSSARDLDIPAQPDHQKVQNIMKRIAEEFCDMPVNFMWTALPMVIESRDGEEKVVPMVHGQKGDTSHYIAGLMDSFGYMEVAENKAGKEVRRIHWQPYNEYTGKDRFGVLGPYTDDITLPEIQSRIESPVPTRRTATTATRRRRATNRRTA